jgi:hypothetical protein
MLMIKSDTNDCVRKKLSEEIKIILEMFRGRTIIPKDDIIEKAIEHMYLIPICYRPNPKKQRELIVTSILRVRGVYSHSKTKGRINAVRIDWDEYDNPGLNELESNIIQDIVPILKNIKDSGTTIIDKRTITEIVLQNVEKYPHLKNYTKVGIRKMVSRSLHHTPGIKQWSEKNHSPSIIFCWDEVKAIT